MTGEVHDVGAEIGDQPGQLFNAAGLGGTLDGESITATATRVDAPLPTQYFDTSEFSQSIAVTALTSANDDAGATTEDSPLVQGAPGVLLNDSFSSSTVTTAERNFRLSP